MDASHADRSSVKPIVLNFAMWIVPILCLMLGACAPSDDGTTSTAESESAESEPAVPIADTCIEPSGPNFLVVSDIHLNEQRPVSADKEDTGKDLWKLAQTGITARLQGPNPPDFVVYLGDLPAHSNATPTTDHDQDIGLVLGGLRSIAQAPPAIPLFYLPGNNDSLEGDYCEFSDQKTGLKVPYSEDAGHEADWPGINAQSCSAVSGQPCIIDDSHRDLGYYSAYPTTDHKLRLIMMNTVMFSTNSCGDGWSGRQDQGDDQLTWLGDQLSDASGEKVLIGMHIPPGNDRYCTSEGVHKGVMWSDSNQQDTFLELLSKDPKQIVGVLTSHTHMDELRMLHGPQGLFGLAVSAPGISPNHGQNPGFKTVYYDRGSTFGLQDFVTHYTEVPLSATSDWSSCYSFRNAYGCHASAATMLDCVSGQSHDQLKRGLDSTFLVKKAVPSCDVSAILDVAYGASGEGSAADGSPEGGSTEGGSTEEGKAAP